MAFCILSSGTRDLSRPRASLDTLLGSIMLSQGGGHGQTEESQEVIGGRAGGGER